MLHFTLILRSHLSDINITFSHVLSMWFRTELKISMITSIKNLIRIYSTERHGMEEEFIACSLWPIIAIVSRISFLLWINWIESKQWRVWWFQYVDGVKAGIYLINNAVPMADPCAISIHKKHLYGMNHSSNGRVWFDKS